MVLERAGEDQLDRSCEKRRSVTKNKVGKEYPTYSKRMKANWIGSILCRNLLPKHVIEKKIEGRIEEIRRCKQLLDDLKEERGYWKLKEEAIYRNLWRGRIVRGCGPVVRQKTG